jgi:hypothetical protein
MKQLLERDYHPVQPPHCCYELRAVLHRSSPLVASEREDLQTRLVAPAERTFKEGERGSSLRSGQYRTLRDWLQQLSRNSHPGGYPSRARGRGCNALSLQQVWRTDPQLRRGNQPLRRNCQLRSRYRSFEIPEPQGVDVMCPSYIFMHGRGWKRSFRLTTSLTMS